MRIFTLPPLRHVETTLAEGEMKLPTRRWSRMDALHAVIKGRDGKSYNVEFTHDEAREIAKAAGFYHGEPSPAMPVHKEPNE